MLQKYLEATKLHGYHVCLIVQAQQEIIIGSKVTPLDWFPETLETPLNTPLVIEEVQCVRAPCPGSLHCKTFCELLHFTTEKLQAIFCFVILLLVCASACIHYTFLYVIL